MTNENTPGFWGWYNRQCAKPFVGILMIPISIFVCFLPMLIFCAIQEWYLKSQHEKARVYFQHVNEQRAAIYAKGEDPDGPDYIKETLPDGTRVYKRRSKTP